jgi:hypothetical protein
MTVPSTTDPLEHPRYERLRRRAEARRARVEQEWESDAGDVEPPTPTQAMLALGTQVTTWTARLVVLTFVLIVIGLAIELGVAEAIPLP